MKCEPCGFQEKPDNMNKMTQHAETCQKVDVDKAKVVWRKGEIAVVHKKVKNDRVFEVELRKLASAPKPPKYVQRNYKPQVVQGTIPEEYKEKLKDPTVE